jgi:hypothetical protein
MDEQNRVRSASERIRIEFLEGELDICETFLDLADIEFDDAKRYAWATSKALEGYETVRTWIGTVRGGDEFARLAIKLDYLRERLSRYTV